MLCRQLEGNKGGTFASGATKFYTAKKTARRRYDDYIAQMNRDKVEVKCRTCRAFTVEWDKNQSIVEVSPTGHAICDICAKLDGREAALEGRRTDSQTTSMRRAIDEDRREHKRITDAPRQVFDDATYLAEHHPHKTTMLNVDAPTRRQFDLPRQLKSRDLAKGLEGSQRWESKVTGIMDAGVGTRMYVAHAAIGGGANLVATVIYLTLHAHVQSGRPLGSNLLVQVDNTCGENKCMTIIALVAWLVQAFSFDDALINCMPVGHTFTLLDQSFNSLISGMHKSTLPTVSAMLEEIRRGMREYRILEVTELKGIFNFAAWFKPVVTKLEGFAQRYALGGNYTGMGQFLFVRDAEGAARLRMRVSPLATSWVPEGPGFKVFNGTALTGRPPYAPLKSFSAWQKDAVEASIRRWLPYLGLDAGSGAETNIREEWEKRLSELTANIEDVEGLPVWKGAPIYVQAATAAAQDAAHTWVGVCENPDVDPITTDEPGGRSDAAYRTQLKAWQQATRVQAAAAGTAPPVHLADYIITKGLNATPCLVCITRGELGQSASDAHVTGTLYKHTPNTEVPGVWGWGTFTPQRNEAYDPNDKRKGPKNMQQQDIGRSNILVYHCATFLDGSGALCLHADTMRELSKTSDSFEGILATTPSTHRPSGGASGSGASGSGASGRGASGRGASGRGASGRGASGRGASGRGASGRGGQQWLEALDRPAEMPAYEVEGLLDRKRSRGQQADGARRGTWMYLVQWEGFDEDQATWVKASDVSNDLIQGYEEEHGSPHSTEDEAADEGGAAAPEPSAGSARRMKHAELFGSSDSDMPSASE
jgi:hypothetical protein